MRKNNLLKAVEHYKDLASQIALLEAQKEALADSIKQTMGETEELCVGSYVIRYKKIVSNRFDSTAFKKAHADVYADFCKASESRRFTII